jgi:glutathionylspermidine synthase
MITNLEYEDWLAGDQQVLSFLLPFVSKEILVRVATVKMVAEAWKLLEEQFNSKTMVCAISTRMALATTRKGNLIVIEYLAKMQGLGNDMAVTGKLLDDEDLIQYILAELDEDYDSVVNSILAHPQIITISALVAQMLSFEARVDL